MSKRGSRTILVAAISVVCVSMALSSSNVAAADEPDKVAIGSADATLNGSVDVQQTDTGTLVSVSSRPKSVPDDYLLTPNGYFHQSCVHEVSSSDVLVSDNQGIALVSVSGNLSAKEKIAAATSVGEGPRPQTAGAATGLGDVISATEISRAPRMVACGFPSYDLYGSRMATSGSVEPGPAPVANGWVESANTTKLGAISYLHAEWNVPTAPSSKSGQTIFFFPGLQNTSGSKTIIMQPVLAWTKASGWYAESWNCCSVGSTYHSASIKVTGKTVSGDVSGNGCKASTGVCSSWSITTYDWGSKRSTTFNTNAGGRKMDWVFGGAFEAYSVSKCSQYPGGSVTFRNFYIEDVSNRKKTPSWSRATASSSLTPKCSYGVTIGSGNSVKLDY